jgi:AraC family transcriptional regulator, regulatory protein of adaptative response / methylated-DNA-[protein]-cysteine methyltransferase
MSTYERISQIIRYLDVNHLDQPDLETLASGVGCSPFHLQRLFSEWAGISPKKFLQCLTLAHATECLQRGESVLDAALESGLSGPGRLHDLCLQFESASPGELKSGGAGWSLSAGFAESPFGISLLAEGPRGICYLSLLGRGEQDSAWGELKRRWFGALLRRDDSRAEQLAGLVFRRGVEPSGGPALRAFVRGSTFQVRVWRALLSVPPGVMISYGQLARRAGMPSAARAVGSAVGANPLAWLIPCHRVIRQTGVLGNYRWGAERKRAMLVWEAAARMD